MSASRHTRATDAELRKALRELADELKDAIFFGAEPE